MSRASQIRETSDATLYLKARELGNVEMLRGCLFRLREQFQVDDRVLVRALNSGQKQGAPPATAAYAVARPRSRALKRRTAPTDAASNPFLAALRRPRSIFVRQLLRASMWRWRICTISSTYSTL